MSHADVQEELQPYSDEEAEAHAREVGVNPRPKETISEIDERGAFIRQPNAFIQPFGDKEGDLKAEAGRYAIYWAVGCNWSNRPVIVRDLLGLQDVIKDCLVTHSGQTNKYGHGFGNQPGHKDSLTGAYFLSEFYKRANPEFTGRATTPTLVDIIKKEAVNNDYHRLTNYLEVQFRPFQPKDAPDLYPKKFRKEIDEFNDWLFPHVNNGHYRMAFCQSPEAYDEAYEDFYESLEKLEKRLETNRFLFGDYITDSDVRAYVTLVRWDVSYYHNIGPVKKPIRDYENIWGYLRELNTIPAFHNNSNARTLALNGIPKDSGKLFSGYNERILTKVDFDKLWAYDGERRKLSKTPDELFLRHPEGETYEEYAGEISKTIWNSPDWEDRNPKNGVLSVDASINPLKDLL
ncbi:MAG: glutathione S-transferase C-terminal domain-containing protein [Lachnoclostridium sp.]|nr:glutathione S-transferase C-terminal domain-containing protein [Lachnospira sp.]MCM1248231.1 glutathione S-transferase C-terminal domain-containing protein [Lachnoclostridium sp.]MCM1534981.1 glutathione S-transferase C-terminal domain-containing protein [Clostridium sp.]